MLCDDDDGKTLNFNFGFFRCCKWGLIYILIFYMKFFSFSFGPEAFLLMYFKHNSKFISIFYFLEFLKTLNG